MLRHLQELIENDKITFDEDVRTVRSAAVAQSYVAVGGKNVMSKPPPQRAKSRIGSMLGLPLGSIGLSKGAGSIQAPDNGQQSFLGKLVGKGESQADLGSGRSDANTASGRGFPAVAAVDGSNGGNAVALGAGPRDSKTSMRSQSGQVQVLC